VAVAALIKADDAGTFRVATEQPLSDPLSSVLKGQGAFTIRETAPPEDRQRSCKI